MAMLQKCPHCGGLGTLWSSDGGKTVYAVCISCGTRTKDCLTPQEASDIWNERVIKTVNFQKVFDIVSETKTGFGRVMYEEPKSKYESEVYTEVNHLKYKLFDMKWSSMSKEAKSVLDKCIDMVDKLPTIKISRGETR